jgi:hypothetical protein
MDLDPAFSSIWQDSNPGLRPESRSGCGSDKKAFLKGLKGQSHKKVCAILIWDVVLV